MHTNNEDQLLEILQFYDEQRMKTYRGLTENDLFEAFHDVLAHTLPMKILEAEEDCKVIIQTVNPWLISISGRNDMDAIFIEEIIKHFAIPVLLWHEKNIACFKRLLTRKKSKIFRNNTKIKYDEINQAREISIITIAEQILGQLRKSGKNYFTICPFHLEKTASFYLYPTSNRFHCFGCQISGDVFTFVQKIFNFTFSQSISYLLNL